MAENCIVISDEEEFDELNLHANTLTTALQKKKPIIPEEVIPDSEEEQGPIKSLPIIPPHTPPRQQRQQRLNEYPSSPLSPLPIPEDEKKKKKKKRKLLKDITLPEQTVQKKARPSKGEAYSSDSPVLDIEKPTSPSEIPMHTPKPRAKPKPKPKAKPRKHKEDSNASPNAQETPLTPLIQPQIDHESPKPPKAQEPLPSRYTQRSDEESNVQNDTLKPKSSEKEQHYRTKENPPPPQPVSKKHTDDILSLVYTKKSNRPLTDILRDLNNNTQSSLYTRRFSPAVSRNFLARIAPLHPNRREPPPPPPPRILPKKTKKEVEREERWEEELQDSIPNWCELTEEERARCRKEKRDWELGLYEE